MGRGGYGYGGGRGGYGGARDDKPGDGLSRIAAGTLALTPRRLAGGYFEFTSTNDLASTFGHVVDQLHR